MRGSSWRGIWVHGGTPRRFGGGWRKRRRLAFAMTRNVGCDAGVGGTTKVHCDSVLLS